MGLTTVGIDYWQDDATKNDSGTIDETLTQHGLYAEHQWNHDDNDLQLALRHDDHDSFGAATTGSIAVGRQFDANNHGFISFGNAFKAPTVNALYWPYSADTYEGIDYITQGNPQLEPETSSTLEVGLTQKFSGVRTSINLYRTWAKNLIDWQFTQTGPTEYNLQPENIGSVLIDGIEMAIRWPIKKLVADMSITLLNAKKLDSGLQLDRRPKAEAQFTLSRNHEAYDWQLQWHLVGERQDLDGGATLAGYGVVDLSYKRQLDRGMELGLRLNNLFDQDYTLATTYSGDYAIPGRAYYLDLGYRF
jgi:vitamin B12 transporter